MRERLERPAVRRGGPSRSRSPSLVVAVGARRSRSRRRAARSSTGSACGGVERRARRDPAARRNARRPPASGVRSRSRRPERRVGFDLVLPRGRKPQRALRDRRFRRQRPPSLRGRTVAAVGCSRRASAARRFEKLSVNGTRHRARAGRPATRACGSRALRTFVTCQDRDGGYRESPMPDQGQRPALAARRR